MPALTGRKVQTAQTQKGLSFFGRKTAGGILIKTVRPINGDRCMYPVYAGKHRGNF